MGTSDLIAVGTLGALVVLGACGALRWLVGALAGLLLGLLILGGLGLMSQQNWFKDLTGGYFADGTVTPAITEQMVAAGRRVRLLFEHSEGKSLLRGSSETAREREGADY